ncbi:UDP-glucose 4-epimerase GalE [Frateuria sp. STR12]|uniref:UDP-glucose 4-epimerase GalE n=1 Tax=Frateuria hangzhouensis TaxID=2995589 RepID=UPI002260BEF8|nr:UDP-glucose 4-epimerase GalE [Frateuria sp. STR12]MCX7515321.1 UDP-glucose 4-epimerase GalE [Frateuria sp. STR12]
MTLEVLVCGGAGYIGSHAARWLAEAGHRVTVLDNLSTGHREAVRWGELVAADIRDRQALDRVFAARRYDAVMHFCALSLVGESMARPYAYYDNNVAGTLTLLEAMRQADVQRLVFSSTAAVFGMPQQALIEEDHPAAPINPYGASKLMVERMLADAALAYGLRSVALRYFNAAGATPSAQIGESHSPETHLIPNALRAAAGTGDPLRLFGNDYPTRDGTCVRDYVHVDDLAAAHAAALDYLDGHAGAHRFNLGNGQGFSVLEVTGAVREVTGRELPFEWQPRRAGDPPTLVASSARAREQLGWNPRYTDLREIIATAWRWHSHPRF